MTDVAAPLPAGLALLLGSPESAGAVFRAAGRCLRAHFQVLGESAAVCQASTVPGDPVRYLNQVLLIAEPAPVPAAPDDMSRVGDDDARSADAIPDASPALRQRLKALERELGRTPGQSPPVIDIDLLCRFDAGGQVRWQDADKLRHPLFRTLLASALPGWPG